MCPRSRGDIRTAHRRLVRATHPDRNADSTGTIQRFREVQTAFETLTATGRRCAQTPFELVGLAPKVSFLTTDGHIIVLGSSHGEVYRLDRNGHLLERLLLGSTFVTPVLSPDNTVVAALVVGLGVPLVLSDRLLPEGDDMREANEYRANFEATERMNTFVVRRRDDEDA